MTTDWEAFKFEFAEFEWDNEKGAKSNRRKHGIDFDEAKYVFVGPVIARPHNEEGEDRWQVIGNGKGRELVVIFTERDDTWRIISARRCSREERARCYEILGE
jgi:hypothetical protein